MEQPMKNRFIKMDPADNVVVLLEPLNPGEELDVEGQLIRARDEIPVGHKMAIRDIPKGDFAIKYGERIGRLIAEAHVGSLVHVHNVYDITEEVYLEERAKLGL
jgi:altronate hydrolase